MTDQTCTSGSMCNMSNSESSDTAGDLGARAANECVVEVDLMTKLSLMLGVSPARRPVESF